jgi:hypothetical protein
MKTICLEQNRLLLVESPNPHAIARLPGHPLIWKDQKAQYEAYHNKLVCSNDGTVAVEYFRLKYGRFYVCEPSSMSATPMWANARAAAFDNDLDIDGIQFHPNLLLTELEVFQQTDPDEPPPKFDALTAMCENREPIFAKCSISAGWLDRYNEATQSMYVEKDVLKNLATLIIFGGSINTWEEKWVPTCPEGENEDKWKDTWKPKRGVDYELCEEFDGYIKQIPKLAKYITRQEKYGDIVEWHRETKKKQGEPEPHPGSCMAIILQTIEADLLLRVMQDFHKIGLTPTVYAYDGFQIRQPQSETEKVKLEAALQKINTYRPRATFVVKPFRPPVPDLHRVAERSTDFDIAVFDKIRTDAKTSKQKQQVFDRQKEYFEMSHFVLTRSGAIGEVEKKGHYKGVSQLDSAMAKGVSFANLRTLIPGKEEGVFTATKFFDLWLATPFRRQFKTAELFPPGGVPCPDQCMNLWTGWKIENTPYEPDADFSLIMNHLTELIPDAPMREYYLNWNAHKVQKPGTKIQTCIVLYGLSGAGKSVVAELTWEAFVGEAHYHQTEKVEDITGKHADVSMNLVVVLNEASGKDNCSAADKLKNAVTQTTMGVEKKCIQKVTGVNCLYDLMMTTNSPHCVKLEGDADRRFVMIVCSSKYANTKPATMKYMDRLVAQLKNQSSMRAFFEYLKQRDISQFDPRVYPSSKLRQAMISAQERPEKSFLQQWLVHPEVDSEHNFISFNGMFKNYRNFYIQGGFKMEFMMDKHKLKAYLSMVDGLKVDGAVVDGTKVNVRLSSGKDARGYKVGNWRMAATFVGLSEEQKPEYSNPQ